MNQKDRDYVFRLYSKAEDALHAAEYDLTGGYLLATAKSLLRRLLNTHAFTTPDLGMGITGMLLY